MGHSNLKTSDKIFELLEEIGIEEIGQETKVDLHSKKLNLREHLILLMGFVLCRFPSMTELCENTDAYDFLPDISKGQLSKVNRNRTYTSFVMIFYALLSHRTNFREHWRTRRYLRKKIVGIDSTQITLTQILNLPSTEVPLLDKEKNGIKIHLAALLGKMVQPLSAIVTPDNVHDSSEFEELLSDVDMFEKLSELILVMDKGYTNYDRYRELDERDISFVVQLKKNAKYTVLSSEKHKGYIDYRIRLEKNGLELRMVEYNGEFKKWTFITNISSEELSGHDIREIYRMRWMIEIFFRKLKQVANIEHLISESNNGVIIQVYSTLVAYTLVNIFLIEHDFMRMSMERFARKLRHYIDKPVEKLEPP